MNDAQRPSVLQIATQAVGLFAGLATIAYLAGGVVLVARLAFANMPWDPIIGQLPRDFVLTTGAGQALLPALIFGSVYGLFRLLRRDRSRPPSGARWRDGWTSWARAVLGYLAFAVLFLIPVGIVLFARSNGVEEGRSFLLILVVLVLIAAVGLQELRVTLGREYRHSWNDARPIAMMTILYSLAAVPAFMAAAAVVPFSDAKVCTTNDFEETGSLVAQAGDRVYLGEERVGKQRDLFGVSARRLAVFPLSQVEEIFIGDLAHAAECDFGDARLALVAEERASAAAGAAAELKDLASLASDPSGEDLADVARDAVSATRRAGLAVLETADAAKAARAGGDEEAWRAGNEALDELERLEETVRSLQGERTSDARRELLADAIGEAARSVQAAATAARSTASAVRDAALRRQPSPG